jgi:hypothetical protein
MDRPVVLPLLVLMTVLPMGCRETPSPPQANPVPTADPAALIKAATAAVKAAGDSTARSSSAGGATQSMIHVNSNTLKLNSDVPMDSSMQGAIAVVNLGKRKLVVEFDKGRVLLDDTEPAKLPTGTKEVQINFLAGKLTVTADGTAVLTAEVAR